MIPSKIPSSFCSILVWHFGQMSKKSVGDRASLFGATILKYPHFGHTYLKGFGGSMIFPSIYSSKETIINQEQVS